MADGSAFNSLKSRLSILIVLVAILPTATIAWMAHNFMSGYVRSDRMEDVGEMADTKHAQLASALRRANGRARVLLAELGNQCSDGGAGLAQACAARRIRTYLASEGALGATLRMKGGAALTVGASAIRGADDWDFTDRQLAKLAGTGPQGGRAYFIAVTDQADGLRLSVTFPTSALQPIFDHTSLLGESGETILVNAQGYFVSEPRHYSALGHEQPITGGFMQTCLAGGNGESLGRNYLETEAFLGYRFVPELGSACIMTSADRAEMFASLGATEKRLAAISLFFLLPAILVALYVTRRIAKSEELRIAHGKMAKETLQKSEALLRAAIDNLPYRTWLKDTDGRYIIINKVYADHLKLDDPQQAVGKTDLELHPRSVAEGYRADDAHVMRTGDQKLVEVQAVENGQVRWLESFKKPIVGHEGTLLGTVGFARDITSRKAEAEQYKLILRTSLDGFWLTNMQGRFVDVNDAYCKLIGYSREELLGMSITDVEAIELPEDTARRIRKLMVVGYDRFETRHRAKDGRILDVEVAVNYTPLYGGRLYCFLHDITKRKRAEDRLRESAERLQSHINNSPMAFVAWNDSYRVTQWSAEAERMFGWSAAETLGRPLMELNMVPEEDLPQVAETMARLADVSSRYVVSANRNVTKDGRILDCVWYNTVLPKKDGTLGSIMSQVLDVTEQKRAERELKESEQRFRTLADATYEGVAITSRGRFLDVNEQMTRIVGYERHELIGMQVADLVAPEDRERVLANIHAELESDTLHDVIRKDGTRITLEVRGHAVRDGDVPIRLTAIRDVSARVKADGALKEAKAEAERANNAKSRFLAAASHDLRQPLTALSLYLDVLKRKLDPHDEELVVKMRECVGGLNSLLSKLLDLSLLDAGVVTPQVRDFSLNDVLQNVIASHAPEAEAKSLRLRLRWCSLAQAVRTDPVLYQRIIGNLVSNAIRYTGEGGVLIGCRRRAGKLWIEVWDTGIGIPHDKLHEVFEEFKQLGDDARTQGSGLGLAIVARTAALLGLQIRVQSRPGRGSVFAIELPHGTMANPAGAATSARPGRAMRIAVVDDNPIVLDALRSGLADAGHEVVAAVSGSELLARLGARPPEIVVCDYRLAAGENGFDVVSSVRAAFDSALPAILITGDTDPKLMRSMTRKGIAILHKPVGVEDLQARIIEATAGSAPQAD